MPTDSPESDGTLEWDSTTIVLAHVKAGNEHGLGYTYNCTATADLINRTLSKKLRGRDAMDIPGAYMAMCEEVRNIGRQGIGASAISAINIALWDLKAKLLHVPLVTLLGAAREAIPGYGSGCFTSYSPAQMQDQLEGWLGDGFQRVKMKIGRDARLDIDRVHQAREVIGPNVELFVDANGAYSRKQALHQAERFAAWEVRWFEEPVSSDDLEGLRLLRDRAPAGMDIAAGEYGWDLTYFQRMLAAGAVDVLQADVTRCGGITVWMQVAALCAARSLRLSAHTAPSVHAHVACAAPAACHVEYFHDHARIEQMLFDGAAKPEQGLLRPDRSRPGLGLVWKERAEK